MQGNEAKKVVVATHGYCFDGLCSAVMFTRLLRHVESGPLSFAYAGCAYGPGDGAVDAKVLTGDVNAVLDFRFTTARELTWYFDHHASAFQGGTRGVYEERAHDAGHARRFFHDAAYGSCTKLIADVGARDFGLDPGPTATLVKWADMIDSASFPSAEFAVERKDPVMQLMTVVEHAGDDALLARMVPRLAVEPLEDVARSAEVVAAYAPLKAQHEQYIGQVKARAVEKDGVVLVDLGDLVMDVAAKFVTYALYPGSAYSVVVSRSKTKSKVSIGYNPWAKTPRRHDISKICERWGGGGHAVVGAISLGAGDVERARSIAREAAAELAT